MQNQPEVYRLSFRFPIERVLRRPALVFTVPAVVYESLLDGLNRHAEESGNEWSSYLSGDATYHHPQPDLFKQVTFGYGAVVAARTTAQSEIELSINITGATRVRHAALMVHYISSFLDGYAHQKRHTSNREQQVRIRTGVGIGPHSHLLAGTIAGPLVRWLWRYGATTKDTKTMIPLPAIIAKAMNSVWQHCDVQSEGRSIAGECTAQVTNSGRFHFSCNGGATDIGIYPDLFAAPEDEIADFDCHNLDRPEQQLTLLAGLAMLSRVVHEEREAVS